MCQDEPGIKVKAKYTISSCGGSTGKASLKMQKTIKNFVLPIQEAREIIQTLCNIKSGQELQLMDRERRGTFLK